MRTHFILGLLSLNILVSCKTAAFRGSAASRNSTKPPPTAPKVVTGDELPKDPIVPTTPGLPTTPAVPPTTPPPLAQEPPVVTPIPPVIIPPIPPSKDIEFGSDKIFRIGDGFAYKTSACVGEVNAFALSGTTYYFQFQVYEDNTQINLSIGRICGVDQMGKDTFSLLNVGSKAMILEEKDLPKLSSVEQANPWVPYSSFVLAKGIYSVVIQSKNMYGHAKVPGVPPDPSKDEYDDFLVGNIRIKANKNVRAEKIYAE